MKRPGTNPFRMDDLPCVLLRLYHFILFLSVFITCITVTPLPSKGRRFRSGWRIADHQQRVERHILQKADLDTDRDNLAEISHGQSVLTAGAQIRQREVPVARQFEPAGDHRGIEIDDGPKLYLDAELHHSRRQRLAIEHPAATFSKSQNERRQKAIAFFVAEALYLDQLHKVVSPPRLEESAVRLFIGATNGNVMTPPVR